MKYVTAVWDKSGRLVLEFKPNKFRHGSGLRITYS